MGQRGPRALPPNVLKFRGASHLSKDALGSVVEPDIEVPDLPAYLQPEAKRFWARLHPELEKLGLIARIDEAQGTLVCSEYAWFIHSDRLYKRDVDAAAKGRRLHERAERLKAKQAKAAGEIYLARPWSGGDGIQVETSKGNLTYNPNWVARNRHSQQLDRLLAAFGMSPSARGKVTPSTQRAFDFERDGAGQQAAPTGFAAL